MYSLDHSSSLLMSLLWISSSHCNPSMPSGVLSISRSSFNFFGSFPLSHDSRKSSSQDRSKILRIAGSPLKVAYPMAERPLLVTTVALAPERKGISFIITLLLSEVCYPVSIELPGYMCPMHRYRHTVAPPLCRSVITLHGNVAYFNSVIGLIMYSYKQNFFVIIIFFPIIYFWVF